MKTSNCFVKESISDELRSNLPFQFHRTLCSIKYIFVRVHGSNYVNKKLVHNKVGVFTRNLSQIPFSMYFIKAIVHCKIITSILYNIAAV